jgi:hypothetical protein
MRAFKKLILISLAVISICACSKASDGPIGSATPTRSYLMGVGPIWKNYSHPTEDNLIDMYEKINHFGEILIAQGRWRDSYQEAGRIPQGIEPYLIMASVYGFTPQVGINFFDENLGVVTAYLDPVADTGGVWRNNPTSQNNYTALVYEILNIYHPEFLALGLEVNTYWEYDPDDFDVFVAYYKSLYTAIKSDSAYQNTKIFVTFQLEKLNKTGLIGDKDWTPFHKFDGYLDVAAFTTYPELIYSNPLQITATYYSEIAAEDSVGIPVAFSEIGWSAEETIQEEKQAAFIDRFFQLTAEMNLEFVNWAFMHDLDTIGPLTKIGLYTSDGTPKTGLLNWIERRDEPVRSVERVVP